MRMRFSSVVYAGFLSIGLAHAASAADSGPAPVGYTPSVEWGGLYVGAHAGHGWGNRTGCMDVLDLNGICDGIIPPIPFDYDQDGWMVGGQFGYNHMLSPDFLIGAEFEASWAAIDGAVGSGFGSQVGEYDLVAAFKARAGWVVHDSHLLYGVAGVAITNFDYSGSFGCAFEETRDGFLFGAGWEGKISERGSLFVEYNHLESDTETNPCTVLGFLPTHTEAEADLDTVKLGFRYRLGN